MKNIICLGDSTTYGYMVNRKNIWTSVLNTKFKEDNKNIILINKGINGDMISGMLARFDIDCIKENPNSVILMGGVNDIFTYKSLEKIEESFINIINKANENDIEIIAFTPIPFIKEAFTFFEVNNLDELEDSLKEYVNFINYYTKTNCIKSIDIYNMFINNILKNHNYYDIYFDGVHLNENGHSVFALELYKVLPEIITK